MVTKLVIEKHALCLLNTNATLTIKTEEGKRYLDYRMKLNRSRILLVTEAFINDYVQID